MLLFGQNHFAWCTVSPTIIEVLGRYVCVYLVIPLFQGCASNPQDAEQQRGLRSAAEELRSATNAAAANAMKRKLIKKLESAAKNAAAASTQLINAAQAATPYNKDNASQTQLMQQCKVSLYHYLMMVCTVPTSTV